MFFSFFFMKYLHIKKFKLTASVSNQFGNKNSYRRQIPSSCKIYSVSGKSGRFILICYWFRTILLPGRFFSYLVLKFWVFFFCSWLIRTSKIILSLYDVSNSSTNQQLICENSNPHEGLRRLRRSLVLNNKKI